MRKPELIVTGGAGLIGANLVAALNARGETDILVVDHLSHPHKKANLGRLQFTDYMEKDAFRQAVAAGQIAAPRTVFHLGACSSTTETRADYLDDNNTVYTRELCQWALANDARFIYASSAATYGEGERGYDDDDRATPTLQPLNLYGLSKHKFDLWALEHRLFDRIVGLKYFNVFGSGEDHKGEMRSVVHKAHEQIMRNGVLQLFRSHRPEYDDGCQDRDFVDVRDAVGVSLFFHDNREPSGLFNCGTGKARTWLDLGRAIFAAMGREPQIEFVDMPEHLRGKYQYHTEALTHKLAASGCPVPSTPLEESVAHYVQTWLAKPNDERRFIYPPEA